MRSQIEKNKEILCDEIEKLSEQKMTESVAAKLSAYRGAYKALCMVDGEKEEAYAAAYIHSGPAPLTKTEAVAWVGEMENADGTRGGHWTMEETEKVRAQKNIGCDPVLFYAAMNMMYSDYCEVAKKFNASSADFYACMAKAFLDDKDAAPHKLARYYRYVARE